MASFVPPQVDHNLYTPILPQDNVQQIFSLLDQKQQMYNQGVKAAQNKISSMLGLQNDVTSGPVKDMVSDFNGKANDLIKQYANLDFSLQSNVNLIDNIYNPLLDNKLFLSDYSGTKNYNYEKQKALGYRDSTNDKVRNLFNQNNLDYLEIKRQDLAAAKTEKDINLYSSRLANTTYTPYHDYNAELLGYMKDNASMFEMVRDVSTEDGYIVSYKNGPQRYQSIKSFVESFLSDKSRTQMEIEESVNFANALRTSGLSKEEFLTQKVDESQDEYTQDVIDKQKEVDEITTLLSSYPTENLNTKQKEEVESLQTQLQDKNALLKRGQDVLSNFSDFMKKAANGEIELSRYYDVAENLVVNNGVQNKITNLSYGLVGPQSITLKKDETFWTNISEDRLERQLQHQIQNDKDKNLIEAAGKGLVFDPITGQWVFGAPGGDEFWDESQNAEGETSPIDINGINSAIVDLELQQNNLNMDATLQIIEAHSFVKDSPLNNSEVTSLKNIINTEGLNTSVSAVYEKYKNDPAALAILNKAGITKSNTTLGEAMKGLVVEAQNYVKNTSADQSGNKAGYYNTLKTSLDEFNINSTMIGLEKKLLIDGVKQSVEEFYKLRPEFKGSIIVDETTGKPKFIQVNEKEDKRNWFEKYIEPALISMGNATLATEGTSLYDTPPTPNPISAEEAFNEFLKTQKGALGKVGYFMQKTTASPMKAFNWLKSNKSLYLNDASKYKLTPEEYKKSVFYKEAGSSWGDTDGTELEVLGAIQSTFLNSIGDEPLNLSNKNIMAVADKVIERSGEIVVFPNRQYMKYIFQIIDKDGKETDIRSGYANTNTYDSFDKMLESVAKNGITIKKDKGSGKDASNIQGYLNRGNVLSISKSNAGSTTDFTISKSARNNNFVLEGKFKDASDFFIQKDLLYKIDKADIETGSIKPFSPSNSFKFYKYDLLPSQVNKGIFETANSAAELQLFFNQQKDSPEFIQNLMAYIESRNGKTNQISGQMILDYLNLINR